MDEMADTYSLPYKCSNCGYGCLVSFKKGQEVVNFFNCPNCGNKTSLKVIRSSYETDDYYTPKGLDLEKVEDE